MMKPEHPSTKLFFPLCRKPWRQWRKRVSGPCSVEVLQSLFRCKTLASSARESVADPRLNGRVVQANQPADFSGCESFREEEQVFVRNGLLREQENLFDGEWAIERAACGSAGSDELVGVRG
jgi:hypothetical protein